MNLRYFDKGVGISPVNLMCYTCLSLNLEHVSGVSSDVLI